MVAEIEQIPKRRKIMSRKSVLIAVCGLLMLLAVSSRTLAADVTGVWRYEGLPDSEVTIAQDGNLVYS